MKYLDEYRDPVAAGEFVRAIQRITTRSWSIMEVCGGQTHTIVKYGIDELLPPNIRLIHGPGCPVCVTPLEMVDRAMEIASRPDVIFCSFGDMLRMPGSHGDLFAVRACGGDVRIVYSPLDCLQLAERHPDRTVVFFAIGFETTAPANAMAVAQARRRGLTNFAVLVSQVLVPPAIAAILSSPENCVQGFLAAGGAEPRYLTVSLILEEGLPMADLQRVLLSLGQAAKAAGVQVVAGDSKVVERGHCDQIYITTTGVGIVPPGRSLSCHAARAGDCVIASGTIGDHGVAIMSVREGLEFETVLKSDMACLSGLTRQMLEVCPDIRCMHDPTRGRVASALNEIARASSVGIRLSESELVVRPEVRAACEMLGLDPLYIRCEGRLLAIVSAADSEKLVHVMRTHPLGRDASVIGEVVAAHPGTLALKSTFGRQRIIPMLSGEQLPRIC